jgi:hypothetical protein
VANSLFLALTTAQFGTVLALHRRSQAALPK